jgi:hypothetical protein
MGETDSDLGGPSPMPYPDLTLPVAELPMWVRGAARSTWMQVPLTALLASVDPMQDAAFNPSFPQSPEWSDGLSRQATVVTAWCGAAYDEGSDTIWLGLGGGHRDYAGNEIYKCHFSTDQPGWVMARPPSGAVGNVLVTNDGQEATGVYADGRPRATHSYNKWAYVPGTGPVLMAHGSTSWRFGGKSWGVFIDPSNGEHAFTSVPDVLSVDRADGAGVCYDPLRRAIWVFEKGTSAAVRYNLPPGGTAAHLGSYQGVGASWSRGGVVSACYVPGHDVVLVGQNDGYSHGATSNHRWRVFDCATGAVHSPAFTGTLGNGVVPGLCQPRWVPALQAACVWDNTSNTTQISSLKPSGDPRVDPWHIGTLPVSGANTVVPTPATPNGTLGRWAYSPRLGGFFVFNSTAGPTYFYKL